jgi:hypothetical protein
MFIWFCDGKKLILNEFCKIDFDKINLKVTWFISEWHSYKNELNNKFECKIHFNFTLLYF